MKWCSSIIVCSIKVCASLNQFIDDFKLATLSAPLILSMLISGSAETIDGLLVGHFLGPEAFAVFRYGARELPFSSLLAAALSTAMVARLSQTEISSDALKELKHETAWLMHAVFPISILFVLCSHWLYPLLFSSTFLPSAGVFNIYLLLVISRSFFPQAVVMASGRHDVIFKTALIELPLNVLFSVLLIFPLGIKGVAWGTFIAFLAEKLILAYRLNLISGIKLSDFQPIRLWIIYSVLMLVAFFASEFIEYQ